MLNGKKLLRRIASAFALAAILAGLFMTDGARFPKTPQALAASQDQAAVAVSANSQWVNTGLKVNVGDEVSITAAGSWTPGAGFGTWGPNGSTQLWPDNFLNLADIGVCRFCARTLTPHFAGLIGYIGESPPAPGSYTSKSILAEAQKVFFVGSNYSANAQLAGALWLNFNDDAYSGFTIDNIGGVTAQITVQRMDTPSSPSPFLDLPWNYEGKGLSFNDAALSINSYFDHEYPLLSGGIAEPISTSGLVTNFNGERRSDQDYSLHDGYDYGKSLAKVDLGDPVLAAASGTASYVNSCSDCGNMILIDHGNGYQTRYLHLQKDGLITSVPGEKVQVNARQKIGFVGATGHVIPEGNAGAHIHFGVFEDKNKDGNFNDNIPDGATDPFGWQSKEKDPWEIFTFFYNGQNRTGNKSFYLWTKKIDHLDATLTSNGGIFNTGRYKVDFPKDTTNQNLNLNILSEPIARLSKEIQSIGSTIIITATDLLGNVVTKFQNLFSITVDFSSFDLTRYNTDTISFYSSIDGINWTKEPTIVDLLNKKATTKVDHITHFALMAERKDTLSPTTTATLSGQLGQANWFRSDVQLSLDAQDNDGGLGLDYTLYKVEDEENTTDWATYITPLTFTQEGHHKIEFYSVDKDENIESVKSIEFDIDKTPPEARIFIDQDKQDLMVEGIDKNQTIVERQDNTETRKKDDAVYVIKDLAGNTVKLDVRERDKEKKDKFKIYSLQYNQDPPIEQPDNHYNVKYKEKKDKLSVSEQNFEIEGEVKIKIKYDSKKNQSTITIRTDGEEKTKEIRDGLILLQITTEKGTLKYSY